MDFPWFQRKGIFFIPITIMGWLLLVAGIAYAVYLFIDINSQSQSVSDTLINFVFNFFILYVIYSLLAFLTSKVPK